MLAVRCDVDHVTAAVGGVAPAFDVAHLLELIEQQDAVVGIEPEGLAQPLVSTAIALETGLAFLPLTLVLGILSLGITARLMGRFGRCQSCWRG